MKHYIPDYLLNPGHAVTITLAGVGGTGTMVLSGLARIHQALVSMGHPGFYVAAYDPDIVTVANVGRQMFSTADIGYNKAIVSVERINRYFGTDWMAMPQFYTGEATANILITCIDTVADRLEINDALTRERVRGSVHETSRPYYWLDIGNLQQTGQVVIGTVHTVRRQSKAGERTALPNVVKLFPQIRKIKDADQGPSCSLAEALNKQDLFINSTMAQFGLSLIWKLFREAHLQHQGCFVNLETLTVNPIKIK